MPLSALSDRDAVLSAIAEYDELGREAFLARYGYGPSRTYFLEHDGRDYDSKAIVGVAVGKQFPDEGPLGADQFSGGEATVRAKLEGLGFQVRGPSEPPRVSIHSRDVELLRLSRDRDRYADLSSEESAAYERVHAALGRLGRLVQEELGDAEYEVRLTSGFHLKSGVRGAIPKDLWFGVYRKQNATEFLGNPQLFAIASGKGVELGFYVSTHPSDFSNSDLKAKLRAAAPAIYRQLPDPRDPAAVELERSLGDCWTFRRKSRLEPGRREFDDLSAWLRYFKSPEGAGEGGGAITRWFTGQELDSADLPTVARDMARTFQPLMSSIRTEGNSSPHLSPYAAVPALGRSFATLFGEMVRKLDVARQRPYGEIPDLWDLMEEIQTRLENLASVAKRPHITTQWSLGKGVWASIPWFALLNRDVTTSTQSGIYVGLLVSEDLATIYATLNQGMTQLVNELGRNAAVRTLTERSEGYRGQIGWVTQTGIELGNTINLKTEKWRGRQYEAGTVAYKRFDLSDLPTDERFEEVLETLLKAYDQIVDTRPASAAQDLVSAPDLAPLPVEEEAYSLKDAMSGVFVPEEEVASILTVWRAKKNIILQGSPGVGKSFIAKRLAFALMGHNAPSRIEAVQFHQSYAYEDFVQGYRPTPAGGFELRDGVFLRFCQAALIDPSRDYVLIIDEINRGNLSKIFGELMLLIEQDKRDPGWATRLTYARSNDRKFYVPENLFIIGMMNTADRSLSMVDYALRRRFAFVTLSPQFSSPRFRQYLLAGEIPEAIVDRITSRMIELNDAIANDTINLGPGFQIGHSFFVPEDDSSYTDGWYERIIETEIRPLLEEYWFDDPKKAADWRERLLAG
ncbi:DUF3578 domain-containing protein [Bradyrhizobium sp. WYCCWR 13022]|uniref:MrcB family domain-containing protein n=1 Tax=unclassified Bradyrhizobium TaxID=2631580 RepID=UPI00263AFDFD|nr:DUF3578 domain-containing protein [Bradyrhizobium sp. WYCCWR 13022]MDN4984296.1 DUF3578 domain-containing protein [Bradyrhizobium sp. WYCCWR 13022]